MKQADSTVAQAVLIVAMCLPIAACKTHEVNTWERWCEQITEVDLEARYRGWAFIFSISYDTEAIRKDFADRFNRKAITSVSNRYFGGISIDDPVLVEMARIRLIGVWNESAELHWAHSYLSLEIDPGFAFGEVVDEIEGRIKHYRNVDMHRSRDTDARAAACIWGTIDGVYETLVLHGPDESVAEIGLRHTLTPR